MKTSLVMFKLLWTNLHEHPRRLQLLNLLWVDQDDSLQLNNQLQIIVNNGGAYTQQCTPSQISGSIPGRYNTYCMRLLGVQLCNLQNAFFWFVSSKQSLSCIFCSTYRISYIVFVSVQLKLWEVGQEAVTPQPHPHGKPHLLMNSTHLPPRHALQSPVHQQHHKKMSSQLQEAPLASQGQRKLLQLLGLTHMIR